MSQEVLLDVRQMIPRERHPKIFKAWEELPVGGSIKLVNDHNPKPLFYEFKAERTGEFEWRPLEEGPERWVVAITRVAAAPSHAGRARGDAPSWVKHRPAIELDVREELRRGGEPLGGILDAAEKIRTGQVLLVRAIFEPRPLFAVLGNQGFESWAVEEGPEDWKAYFYKKPWCHVEPDPSQGAAVRSDQTVREVAERYPQTQRVFAEHGLDMCCGGAHPIEATAAAHGVALEPLLEKLNTAVADAAPRKTGAGKTHALDVRGLEAPEPMVRILSALPAMGPEDVLEVTHFREPFPLYEHLKEAGFAHTIEKLEENLYRLKISRKG